MILQIGRECLAYSIESSAHHFQRVGIVDIFNVAEWKHFVLPMQASRLCCCARDEKKASLPSTFRRFVTIISRTLTRKPTHHRSSRNGTARSVWCDATAKRWVAPAYRYVESPDRFGTVVASPPDQKTLICPCKMLWQPERNTAFEPRTRGVRASTRTAPV